MLHGLVELETRVDGLLIELTDWFSDSWCLVEEAARACNSGIRRGGRLAGLRVESDPGMTMPKIASSCASKDDPELLKLVGGRAVRVLVKPRPSL
jgi:hypothetical protein